MLRLSFHGAQVPQRILCFGAHCDDVEIGCGGTLLQLAASLPDAEIRICTFSGNDEREAETREALARFLGVQVRDRIDVKRFRNGHFPYCATEIKDHIESYKPFQPDLVFTHYRFDQHQDHRTISELTANTFRNNLVLEYEILKYDSDLGNPNVFVPLSRVHLDLKTSILLESFKSQHEKQWFTRDVFESMARIRGVQSASPTGLAEAFYGYKLALELGES